MKIANIEREILHIFWTTWGISLKISGKMWLMIILKVTKKTEFHPFFSRYIFRKITEGGGGQIEPPPPSRLRVNSWAYFDGAKKR